MGWSLNPAQSTIVLEQWVDVNKNNARDIGETRNLEVANTRVVDQTTGVISFDCTLGGKVYLDPNLGTVRFYRSGDAGECERGVPHVSADGAPPEREHDVRLLGLDDHVRLKVRQPLRRPEQPSHAARTVPTTGARSDQHPSAAGRCHPKRSVHRDVQPRGGGSRSDRSTVHEDDAIRHSASLAEGVHPDRWQLA